MEELKGVRGVCGVSVLNGVSESFRERVDRELGRRGAWSKTSEGGRDRAGLRAQVHAQADSMNEYDDRSGARGSRTLIPRGKSPVLGRLS